MENVSSLEKISSNLFSSLSLPPAFSNFFIESFSFTGFKLFFCFDLLLLINVGSNALLNDKELRFGFRNLCANPPFDPLSLKILPLVAL